MNHLVVHKIQVVHFNELFLFFQIQFRLFNKISYVKTILCCLTEFVAFAYGTELLCNVYSFMLQTMVLPLIHVLDQQWEESQ